MTSSDPSADVEAKRQAEEEAERLAEEKRKAEEERDRQATLASIVPPIALFVIAIALLTGAAWVLSQGFLSNVPQQIQLPLLLILGVVVLLVTLGALVALMQQWGLIDSQEAMGLPKGTIRAVIALGLILIFAISAVFLVVSADATTVSLTGVTAERLQTMPMDRIVAVQQAADGTSTVELLVPTGFRDQISQQLLTVMATLVTAVVAFYFGTASARVGTEAFAQGGALRGFELLNQDAKGRVIETMKTELDALAKPSTQNGQPDGK